MARSNPQFRLYLLGIFRIESGSGVLRLPTRKHESLLAYLALHPEPHSRESLAALFWGDTPDEQARMSLRTALAALRRQLGDDLFITDRATVQINPGFPLWIDTLAIFDFRLPIADSEIENLKSKIENYHDLLPDFYDDWILPERERLRGRYHDALLALTQDARVAGDYARAMAYAQKLLASDPSNEKAHQHLMFCYAATGDRAAALKQYDDCLRTLREELNVAPARETIALYEQIKAQDTGAPSHEALFTNLPIPLTSFIGREGELTEIKRLLEGQGIHPSREAFRLLTCTGAGGCGKTRLAIQAATDLAREKRFRDGVWWVDLSALNDAALVVQSVAAVFDVRESREVSLIAALANYLRFKELLLVLDNCEHLLGACAQLVGALLSACPGLRILATSREALNIGGETIWRVPSLALPDLEHLPPPAQLQQIDALRLFSERARAVAANWRLVENTLPVAQICARLDGIPLAIELAAARLKVMSAQQIAARLDDRFDLLTSGSRIALPRHQTLRAAMDWSYDLLSDAERALLRWLAVFAGGFSLEAAESVDSGQWSVDSNLITDHRTLSTLDLLTALIDKSLVVVEQKGDDTRYRLLETVRQYAREKLIESGESDQAQTRHRDYFVGWIEQAAPHLRRADALEWRDRIEWEYDNLRAAFEYAIDRDAPIALRIAWGLHLFWKRYGFVSEGRVWLERLLPQLDARAPIAPRARAWNLAGYLAYIQMDIPNAIRMSEQALALAQSAEEEWEIGFALQRLGWASGFVRRPNAPRRSVVECHTQSLEIFQRLGDEEMITESMFGLAHALGTHGELERGVALFQQAIARQRAAGNREGESETLAWLSLSYTLAKDYDSAEPYAQQALALARTLRTKNALGTALIVLGRCVLRKDEPRRAMPYSVEAVRLFHERGDVSTTVMVLEEVALCVGLLGKPDPAARIFGAIQFQWETKQATPLLRIGIYDRQWGEIRAQLGDAAFDRARAEGRALSLDQAVEFALENVRAVEIGD